MMKGGRWPWGRDFCKVAVLGGEAAAKQGWRVWESAVADPPRLLRRQGVQEWRSEWRLQSQCRRCPGELWQGVSKQTANWNAEVRRRRVTLLLLPPLPSPQPAEILLKVAAQNK